MTIAIDYDGTWTADPDLWEKFAGIAAQKGHKVIIATGRHYYSDDMRVLPKWLTVIYTKGQLKEQALLKEGIKVDIWCDDMPGMIQECRVIKPSPDQEL